MEASKAVWCASALPMKIILKSLRGCNPGKSWSYQELTCWTANWCLKKGQTQWLGTKCDLDCIHQHTTFEQTVSASHWNYPNTVQSWTSVVWKEDAGRPGSTHRELGGCRGLAHIFGDVQAHSVGVQLHPRSYAVGWSSSRSLWLDAKDAPFYGWIFSRVLSFKMPDVPAFTVSYRSFDVVARCWLGWDILILS